MIFLQKHKEFLTLAELKHQLGDLQNYKFQIYKHKISYQNLPSDTHNVKGEINVLRKELSKAVNDYNMTPGYLRDEKFQKQIILNKIKKEISELSEINKRNIDINKDSFLKSISQNVPSILIKNNNSPDLLNYSGPNEISVIQNGELFAILEKEVPDNFIDFQKQVDALNLVFEKQFQDALKK